MTALTFDPAFVSDQAAHAPRSDAVARHERRTSAQRWVLLRDAFRFALVVLSFKIFLCVHLGFDHHTGLIDTLTASQSVADRTAAKLLMLDPASKSIAVWIEGEGG